MRPDTDTSVRAWPTLVGNDTVASIVWTQVSGPTVTMDTTDNRLLMFKSPKVAADTVLKFRAVMTTSSGRVDQDDVMVGIETQAAKPNGYMFDSTERVHPYRSTGLYTSVLARCAYDISLFYDDTGKTNFCASGTLPLLQTEAGPGAIPTVAQIMSRVLVSHDFLGANFEQFLLNHDPLPGLPPAAGRHVGDRARLARAAELLHGRHRRDLSRRQQPVDDARAARRRHRSAGLPAGVRRPAELQ